MAVREHDGRMMMSSMSRESAPPTPESPCSAPGFSSFAEAVYEADVAMRHSIHEASSSTLENLSTLRGDVENAHQVREQKDA